MEELWCLGVWEDIKDYILCEWDEDLLPKLYKQDQIRFEYNQSKYEWSKKSCTIFGAVWMASDLMNYEFSINEIKEIDESSYQNWRIRGEWRYTKSAVHLVYKRRNENEELVKKYGKIAYYRINKRDTMVEYALDNLYTLDTNFCPTTEYSLDYRRDAMLDGKDFGYITNWHCADIIKEDGQRSVKDNYKGRKTLDGKKACNIYGLKHKLEDITNYSEWLYIYTKVKEDNMEEIKRLNEIKSKLLQGIPLNSELRYLTNSKEYRKMLNTTNNGFREWLEYINKQLVKLN